MTINIAALLRSAAHHQNDGQLFEAERLYRRVLASAPNQADSRLHLAAHMNLAGVLKERGELDEVAAQLYAALKIDPNCAEAHCNLGTVHETNGEIAEAVKRYQRALELKPNFVEAHNNLGVARITQGRLKEAAAALQQALVHRPEYVRALNNLARVHISCGDATQALSVLSRALSIRDSQDTKTLFVQCVKGLPTPSNVVGLRPMMIRALSEPWGRPNDLAQAAVVILKQHPVLGGWIRRAVDTSPQWPARHGLSSSIDLASLGEDDLLRALLLAGPVSDIALERLLTVARGCLLEIATAADSEQLETSLTVEFCSTLARQCFINEYIFAVTDNELDTVTRLQQTMVTALRSETSMCPLWIAAVATYFPLHTTPMADALLRRSWPEAVKAVLVQQISEPKLEKEICASIPRMTVIEDAVSLRVRQQYEENPYPRWVTAAPPRAPLSTDEFLRRLFPLSTFRKLGKRSEIDILIAGCGSGQHAIEARQRFSGPRILAIDLSLASLAYAKRKASELGINDIEFAQADILELAAIGQTFDVIEASGVLHHLANPFEGWRGLVSLLRPGGFMAVGLYSETARRGITKVRTSIASRYRRANVDDIRRCRQELITRGSEVTGLVDFFTASTCRDLLLHVQEHHVTIGQITDFLSENRLELLGFELDPHVLQSYRTQFPDDSTLTNLRSWAQFEREYPRTFSSMYQFWVQKIS